MVGTALYRLKTCDTFLELHLQWQPWRPLRASQNPTLSSGTQFSKGVLKPRNTWYNSSAFISCSTYCNVLVTTLRIAKSSHHLYIIRCLGGSHRSNFEATNWRLGSYIVLYIVYYVMDLYIFQIVENLSSKSLAFSNTYLVNTACVDDPKMANLHKILEGIIYLWFQVIDMLPVLEVHVYL